LTALTEFIDWLLGAIPRFTWAAAFATLGLLAAYVIAHPLHDSPLLFLSEVLALLFGGVVGLEFQRMRERSQRLADDRERQDREAAAQKAGHDAEEQEDTRKSRSRERELKAQIAEMRLRERAARIQVLTKQLRSAEDERLDLVGEEAQMARLERLAGEGRTPPHENAMAGIAKLDVRISEIREQLAGLDAPHGGRVAEPGPHTAEVDRVEPGTEDESSQEKSGPRRANRN
jgi:hypothetical protein